MTDETQEPDPLKSMTDAELWDSCLDLLWDVHDGELHPEDWDTVLAQLRSEIDDRRAALVENLKRTPEEGNRASIRERLSEYRRMSDELLEAQYRREDRRAAWAQQQVQREQTAASNNLAEAGHKQARALTAWTRVLAVATVGLFIATGVLVWVTATNGG